MVFKLILTTGTPFWAYLYIYIRDKDLRCIKASLGILYQFSRIMYVTLGRGELYHNNSMIYRYINGPKCIAHRLVTTLNLCLVLYMGHLYTLPAKIWNIFSFQRFFVFCGVCKVFIYLIYIPISIYYFLGVNSHSIVKWTAKVKK